VTKPFTAYQKLRILVRFGALALVNGAWIPISQVAYGTMNAEKRLRKLHRIGCAVKCACGCETWALLRDIEFDHEKQHALGGPTTLDNGRPLRTTPCHREKTAVEQAVIGWCDSVRRKLRVRSKAEVWEDRQGQGASRNTRRLRTRSSIPSRPMPSRASFQRYEARS